MCFGHYETTNDIKTIITFPSDPQFGERNPLKNPKQISKQFKIYPKIQA